MEALIRDAVPFGTSMFAVDQAGLAINSNTLWVRNLWYKNPMEQNSSAQKTFLRL